MQYALLFALGYLLPLLLVACLAPPVLVRPW